MEKHGISITMGQDQQKYRFLDKLNNVTASLKIKNSIGSITQKMLNA